MPQKYESDNSWNTNHYENKQIQLFSGEGQLFRNVPQFERDDQNNQNE